MSMEKNLTFKLYTVDSQSPTFECDYVKLNIADDKNGKFSGSYGIKSGHTNAVFALSEGTVNVYKDEKVIFSAETSDGFAVVEDNAVSVTVQKINH